MADKEVYLTPDQVAERLQLNRETVYRWLKSGRLKGTCLSPRVWRISEADLRAVMEGNNAISDK